MGVGLVGATRLVDDFDVVSTPEKGTTVSLFKGLPAKAPEVSPKLAASLVDALGQETAQSPFEEMQGQNQELLAALDEVQSQKRQLSQLNAQLAAALEKAEQESNAKTEFLANMSHEIRTPMNAILGLAALLGRTPLSPTQERFVETLHLSAESMTSLVNDLLDVSKIENDMVVLEEIPFNLKDVVSRIVQISAVAVGKKGVDLSHDTGDLSDPLFVGDPQRIHQIVLNLVSNAVKFTSAGSVAIKVTAAPQEDGRSEVSIAVQDTGIGIPDEALRKIFEKFVQADSTTTRRFGGTGLGLSIARSLATMMGGDLSVTSVVNEGSTFTLRLTLDRSVDDLEQVLDNLPHVETAARRILVVEDNEANLLVATSLLEDMGYVVFAVQSGGAAVEFIAAEPVDVILMDIEMHGMDGFEATKQIRAWEKTTGTNPRPIIATTAYELAATRQRCKDVGMNDFVAKPIVVAQLDTALKRQIALSI